MNKEEVLKAYLIQHGLGIDFDSEKEFYIVHDLENAEEISEYIREITKDYLEGMIYEASANYDLPFLLEYVDFKGLLNEELSQNKELSDLVCGEDFEYNGRKYFIEHC